MVACAINPASNFWKNSSLVMTWLLGVRIF